MPSHKSEDYKITAVKFHIENESSFVNTCKIFKCSERSLKRWIEKYKTQHNELNKSVENAIAKVKPENYKNYFNYAYDKEQFKLPSKHSTRRRMLKK
jgi:transposase-like protein